MELPSIKPLMKKIGAIILTIGVVITVFTATNFTFTTSETVLDAVNIQINQRKEHGLPWTPTVGIVIMLIGGGTYLLGGKRFLTQ